MQTSQFAGVFEAEFRQASRECARPGTREQPSRREGEEGPAAGVGPDLALLRLPRATRFAEGGVVTLQHWLDLNA